ncbi:HAD-IA family hydrolase [Roseomonas hellenica]|uniref:Phosphoglycolate phosphatase n=1 Tax=Plastoroseomonas hellenica TaxID=2687306 RepID=A0ABS5EVD5_9PROT|nr:HAD-IA family hydrolase [Plastoroseomonas hellenica]MBR0664261.1 HAD-IA family hydrolase [Plastoroseomonas hellenica]
MPPILLLDLDGTLVDSVPDLLAALDRLLVPLGATPFTRAEVTAMVGDGVPALVSRAFAARAMREPPEAAAAFLADYTPRAAELTRPFPGIAAMLGALSDAGWRLAVCTNKPEAPARALLGSLGLAPHLAAIGGGDSFPVKKPDPRHLLATLEAAGGRAEAAVMLGDHANDIDAARGAGIPAIFAGWGYGPRTMAADAPVAETPESVPALAGALLTAR